MITLFKSDEIDFSHNGLGNLDAYIQNPVVEEVLNGLYSFTFRYPLFAPHGLEIEGQSIIRVPVPEKEDQLFRVYRPVKSMGYITVSCYHIFYDLADNFIEDTNIVEKSGQGAIQQLGGATQFGHDFRFFSDIQKVANSRLVRKNVVASILDDEQGNSFVSRWGGELIRNNFDVRMNQSAGTNAGFTVKHRKNLTGYEADVNYSTIITRIMPKGFDGLLLPEKYIDSPLIGNYETPKIQMMDYNDVKAAIGEYADDEDAIPLEDAYAELRRLVALEYSIYKVDVPSVQYKVDFVMLEQTEEYKDLEDLQKLKRGDMVTVDHVEDDFKVTAKLVRYKYNPISKRYLLAELGSIHEGLTTSFTNINKINRDVAELKEQTLIIQSSADGKNTIYRGEPEPSNPNLGDLWYKPNGNETEMYQFVDESGQKYWKLIADTGDVTQVKKDVDEAIDSATEAKNQADNAVANANLATQNATEAITQAQSSFDLAQESLSLGQGLSSRMVDAEGNITAINRTTQSLAVQLSDVDGNVTSLTATARGLQNRMVDAEGNISSVTQIATGLQSRLTDAEGNINTLTTTASSLDSTIKSVKADLDNLEIDGRNLSLGTSNEFKAYDVDVMGSNVVVEANIDGRMISHGDSITFSVYISNIPVGEQVRLRFSFFKSDGSNVGSQGITGYPINKDGRHSFTSTVPDDDFVKVIGGIAPDRPISRFRVMIKEGKLEKGGKATPWLPAPEEMATQSQITQLSDNINLRVEKGDIINQINVSTESILISGKRLILDGDTTVTGTFRVANANITSVSASKMTTGTLNAANVNIINMNASNISSGYINVSRITGITSTFVKSLWNSVTNSVQITGNGLETFSGGTRTSLLNGSGHSFYRDGYSVGSIGTNNIVNRPDYRGLTFDLENEASYMSWSYREKPSDTTYKIQLAWYKDNAVGNKGFNFHENVHIYHGSDLYVRTLRTTGHTSGSRVASLTNFTWDGNNGVMLNRGTSGGGIFMTNARAVLIDNKNAHIEVGSDSTGNYVKSTDIYNRTYTSTSQMVRVTNAGTLGRSTSSRRYKLCEEEIPLNYAKRFLNVKTKSWIDKRAAEEYAHTLSTGEETERQSIERIVGNIAEDMHDEGLQLLVNYDDKGRADGIASNAWVLHTPLISDLYSQVDILTSQNDNLILKVASLEQRINKLEVAT